MTTTEAARKYTEQGFLPVPIPRGEKGPVINEWQKKPFIAEDFQANGNIGIKTGNGLTDIDCDCLEAVTAAALLLPDTPMKHGRRSNPTSHYWYRASIKTEKFIDPEDGKTLIEIRSDNVQTMVPPSIHPSGERVEWEGELTPAAVEAEHLRRRVAWTAAAAHLARRWRNGTRNELCLSVAGALAHGGISEDEALLFIEAVCRAAGDNETAKRLNTVRDTYHKHQDGEAVTGLPRLTELLGEKVTRKFIEWIGMKKDTRSRAQTAAILRPNIIRLSDIEPEEVSWLWKPYIPLGKLTFLEGDPGIGKTFVALSMAAIISRGWGFPNPLNDGAPGEGREPGDVLILCCEDGIADTLRPRLDKLEADVRKIHVLTGYTTLNPDTGMEDESPVWLSSVTILRQAIERVCPMLVIVDPLQGFLGGDVDMHRANEVRPVLSGLVRLAEEFSVAFLLNRHLGKSQKDNALYRGLGSIDFAAAARSIMIAGQDPENPERRVIAHVKSSLEKAGPSIGYEILVGRFFWRGVSSITADDLMRPVAVSGGGEALSDAVDFLKTMLSEGPIKTQEIRKEARQAGISDSTLRRAKEHLKIIPRRGEGKNPPYFWELPSRSARSSTGCSSPYDEQDEQPEGNGVVIGLRTGCSGCSTIEDEQPVDEDGLLNGQPEGNSVVIPFVSGRSNDEQPVGVDFEEGEI